MLTRRSLVLGAASLLATKQTDTPVKQAFDHLLLGVSDLDHGIAWFEQRTGVRAVMGGVHPGRGTRNALASLGGEHYLEIIGPDPAQIGVNPQFPVGSLREPRLIKFAVRTTHIESTAASLRKAGVTLFGPQSGSRRTVSGALLRWQMLGVESRFQEGAIDPIPFFIEWARDSAHPSENAPRGCTIEDLHFEHPHADELRAALTAIGLEASVVKMNFARIIAMIHTPRGRLELD
jgi:hypothetical protein